MLIYRTQYFDVKQDPTTLEEMLLHSKGDRDVSVIVESKKSISRL
jgi:hypothetical protein